MLFSMAAGTQGVGTERYGLYLPFELPYGRTIKLDEGGSTLEIAGTSFKTEALHHRYAIHGGEFETVEEAKAQLDNLRAALLWFSLKHQSGLRYPEHISHARIYDEPKRISGDGALHSLLRKRGWTVIHGDFDADKAIVLPQHLCLTRWEAGKVGVHTDLDVEGFAETLREAVSFHHVSRLHGYPKLILGIELYAVNHFEVSDEAKFLTLVGALEATLEDESIPEASIEALDSATESVRAHLDRASDACRADLEHLLQRLASLKRRSISDQFRRQIATRGAGLIEVESLDQSLTAAYGTRSRLLHDGRADPERVRQDLKFLRQFVPAYLSREFRVIAGAL